MKISFLSVVIHRVFFIGPERPWRSECLSNIFVLWNVLHLQFVHSFEAEKRILPCSSFIILKIGPISLSPNSSAWFTRASLTVLYPTRTTVFLGPKNTWICSRRFWRAGEHRERHLQTNQKMLGCYHYLNVFKSSSHLKKVSKGLVRSRVSRFPTSGSGFGPGGSFPFFRDLDPEERKYKTRSNSKELLNWCTHTFVAAV